MKESIKNNVRNNKTRIIVYGIITILTIAFSISGAILYKNGHGTVGSVRVKLIPIANTFNKLDTVIRKGYVSAACDGKEIVVTYSNETGELNEKFVYTYNNENGIEYLTNSYSDKNSEYGYFIAENMMEAIYKYNKGEGNVSDKYRLSSFTATSIKDGAVYQNKEEITTVNLNIKTNIVENAVALNIETIQQSDYIHTEELADMLENLKRSRTFRIVKKDTTAYVKDGSLYYEVFFSFKDKEILNRSAGSIISILNPTLYKKLDDGTGAMDFSVQSNDFRVIENVAFQEPGIFTSNYHIYEIIIFK